SCDPVKAEALGSERSRPFQKRGLSFIEAIWLPALASALLRALPHPRAAQFEHYLRFLILRDGPHHLTHEDALRIVRHEVGFRYTDELEAMFPKVRDDGFLNHEIARQSVQPLDDDHLHAIGM